MVIRVVIKQVVFNSQHPLAAATGCCTKGKGQACAGSPLSCEPMAFKRFYFLALGLTWPFQHTELCFTSTMCFQPGWKPTHAAPPRLTTAMSTTTCKSIPCAAQEAGCHGTQHPQASAKNLIAQPSGCSKAWVIKDPQVWAPQCCSTSAGASLRP